MVVDVSMVGEMKWNPPSQIDMAMVGFALPLKGCTHPTTEKSECSP